MIRVSNLSTFGGSMPANGLVSKIPHGSCRPTGGGRPTEEGAHEVGRDPLDAVPPLEDRHVLVQVDLVHPTERPQEAPRPRPQPLRGVVMHLPGAVPVVVP